MTYFGFLLRFLVVPIVIFAGLEFWAVRKGWRREGAVAKWPILLMVLIALVYTTPWDNYLVATGVWFYNPELVTGIVFGWVPIEEYTFFVLQPIMVGLWLALWARALTPQPPLPRGEGERLPSPRGRGVGDEGKWRWGMLATVAVIWIGTVVLLASGWRPGTYLGLELVWALPPVMIQLAFGGDILRRYWKLTGLGIVLPTLYLSAMDALAITAGTWTIDPAQSTGAMLGGVLPIEEFVFFTLTNVLVTIGLVLVWAPESQARIAELRQLLQSKLEKRTA
ncbi:MAG: lycopene cyclase domain-containing protein [Anaerolineales bacterium]|nr:lycopene cyclase domain-containing protein [Anaerolineales bacterium]